MKKKLNRSLLTPTLTPREPIEEEVVKTADQSASDTSSKSEKRSKPRIGGAGSAWKAGAAEQSRAALLKAREQISEDILNGQHEISLLPSQVTDKIGTDRRADWKDQNEFRMLFESIEQYGQDTPIQVWPVDPDWQPDEIEPSNVDGVQFELVTGRRRHAIAEQLDRPVRAILASPKMRGSQSEAFELLFMRFRENELRENLGPFERLVAIGELFEALKACSEGTVITAVSFANKIGVHESVISRARAAFKHQDTILKNFKNAYDLGFPELQKILSSLSDRQPAKAKSKPKPKKLVVTKKIGTRKLSLSSQGGKFSASASGMNLDSQALEELGDIISEYLNKQGSD
jgi:ParB family chromosome partitioning protein